MKGLQITTWSTLLLIQIFADECPSFDSVYKSTHEILHFWSIDVPDIPSNWVDDQIPLFNWKNSTEMDLAKIYKKCELPHKIYGVPEIEKLSEKWTDEYLSEKFKEIPKNLKVTHSTTYKVPFYRPNKIFREKSASEENEVPPVDIVNMSFEEWRELAKTASLNKIDSNSDHWYLESFCKAPKFSQQNFIAQDLPIFSTVVPNYWVPYPVKNKGIQCRFGMRGVYAASHFDNSRNYIAMIKGQKRYIIHPPDECLNLGIDASVESPIFRHTKWDWADKSIIEGSLGKARALETVVNEGEVLYLPSFWFHGIGSVDYSIQCNTRHGAPENKAGMQEIQNCHFKFLGH